MTKSKEKGTAAETAVVRYLRSLVINGRSVFPYVERRALTGGKDKGDIAGIPGVVIEVKAAKRLELAAWKRETLEEMANADASWGVLVVKRPYKAVHEWDAYMPVSQVGVYASTDTSAEDEWVRMDFRLAIAHVGTYPRCLPLDQSSLTTA